MNSRHPQRIDDFTTLCGYAYHSKGTVPFDGCDGRMTRTERVSKSLFFALLLPRYLLSPGSTAGYMPLWYELLQVSCEHRLPEGLASDEAIDEQNAIWQAASKPLHLSSSSSRMPHASCLLPQMIYSLQESSLRLL